MKNHIRILALALCLSACKSKTPSSNVVDTTQSPAENTPAIPVPTPTAKPVQWPKVSPEQMASTVLVKVMVGGLPPKTYTGALLHRESLQSVPGMQGKRRCVLALLTGWEEGQLRDRSCRMVVVRNRLDNAGATASSSREATLLQFDKNTGIAAITYVESFDAAVDVGYRLSTSPAANDNGLPVRAVEGTDPGSSTIRRNLPLLIAGGIDSSKAGARPDMKFPAREDAGQPDPVSVLAVSADKLIGFIDQPSDAATKRVSVADFRLQIETAMLKPISIGFGQRNREVIPFILNVEATGPRLDGGRARLRVLDAAESAGAPVPGIGSSAPLQAGTYVSINSSDGKRWTGSLRPPASSDFEGTYLLQLAWQGFRDDTEATVFSPIFSARVTVKAGQITAETVGVENLNAAKASQAGESTSFPLENPVREFFEIAGGSEVLMQMSAPPYWKRFSMTRKEWLPLPQMNLQNAFVTGNRNALFILDRGAAEVRKYSLTDLKPAGAVKLPTGADYVAVLAGANSERAPIHVLSQNDVISLSPETLQRQDVRFLLDDFRKNLDLKCDMQSAFRITGDGLSFIPCNSGSPFGYLHYNGDGMGVSRRLFGSNFYGDGTCGTGVSGAFTTRRDDWLTTIASPRGEIVRTPIPPTTAHLNPHWLSPVAPIIFRLISANPKTIPPQAGRVECFSYYDSTPFAEFETPELNDNYPGVHPLEAKRWHAFDPASLRFGVLSKDRQTWVVHQIPPVPSRPQPVLLNWPDTILRRGMEWHFKPLLLGGSAFTAELIGAKESSVKVENGEVVVTVAPQEFASLQLLKLKVPGKEEALDYYIPLHIFGPELPAAVAAGSSVISQPPIGFGFDSLALSKDSAVALRSATYVSAVPVRQVLGPIANHLIFVTDAQRVDFYSLETGKLVRSIASPLKAAYFAGGDALFEYDVSNRTLARIAVPTAVRERTMTLPNGLRLHALAAGTVAGSPLTLLLEQIQGQSSEQYGDATVTLTKFDRNAVVLDSRSLQAESWGQPKLMRVEGAAQLAGNPYNFGLMTDMPLTIPAAHNGQFVTLPFVFMALGRGLSLTVPFPQGGAPFSLTSGLYSPLGSISGTIVSSSSGTVYNGGVQDNSPSPGVSDGCVTPCGRYRLSVKHSDENFPDLVQVETVENHRMLFELSRLSFMASQFNKMTTSEKSIPLRMMALGDSGPLVVLAGGGRLVQIVDLDIPKVAKQIAPESFHVTSQAPPCVVAGGTVEYQIEVNNPGAVSTFRLRNEMAGVTVTPQGRLRFTAPQVTALTRVQIAVDIEGKEGRTVIHDFPLFVLPMPRATPPPPSTSPLVPRRSI